MQQTEKTPELALFQRDELKTLAGAAGPCVSLYVPVRPQGAGGRENPIRIKESVKAIEQQLSERGLAPDRIKELLAPVHDLTGDPELGGGEGEELVVLRSPDVFRSFRRRQAGDELAVVADHFYVRPLLAAAEEERAFFILALSRKHARLLRCTNHSSEEVPLPESVPTNLDAFNEFRKPDHDLENRAATTGGSVGSMRGVHFGTNSDSENLDNYMHNFFRAIDKGLNHDVFKTQDKLPMVIVGTEKELTWYREANTYPHLIEYDVRGSADGLKGGDLHARALEAVQKFWTEQVYKILDQYQDSVGAGRASSSEKEVVKAAYDGRVAHLFITEKTQFMGSFDEATRRVRAHNQPHLGEEDLVNAAALQTLRNSGEVHIVSHSKIPGHAAMCALLRY